MSGGNKASKLSQEAAARREPWLEHVWAARTRRPNSARHVARPKVTSASARRPASARPASAPRPARHAVGGVFLRAQQWAAGVKERGQSRPRAPKAQPPAARSHGAVVVRKSKYSVHHSPRARCTVVAGRQPLAPRPAVERPTSARADSSPAPDSVVANGASEDAGQQNEHNDMEPSEADLVPAVESTARAGETTARLSPEEEVTREIQELRSMLGVPDRRWAFAPGENVAFNGAKAMSGSGQRRLLMPTWAHLAQRVELMQQQNREVAGLLTELTSTTVAPVPQQPTRASGNRLDPCALPGWPDEGPLASINPQQISTGWQGLPESSLRRKTTRATNTAPSHLDHTRPQGMMARPPGKEVTVKLEPGDEWSELLW